jgi:C_GCAxxG_C_C family probable redox protein
MNSYPKKRDKTIGNRKELLLEMFESALQNDMNYRGCTQSVLAALQEKMRIGSPEVFKAGSILAGGVARHGETCGALIGTLMAIGVICGRETLSAREEYEMAMEQGSLAYKLFKEKVGHTLCAEIHKIRFGKVYRLHIPEERQAFHEAGGHSRTGCPEVCGIAAVIAAEIILDLKKEGREN